MSWKVKAGLAAGGAALGLGAPALHFRDQYKRAQDLKGRATNVKENLPGNLGKAAGIFAATALGTGLVAHGAGKYKHGMAKHRAGNAWDKAQAIYQKGGVPSSFRNKLDSMDRVNLLQETDLRSARRLGDELRPHYRGPLGPHTFTDPTTNMSQRVRDLTAGSNSLYLAFLAEEDKHGAGTAAAMFPTFIKAGKTVGKLFKKGGKKAGKKVRELGVAGEPLPTEKITPNIWESKNKIYASNMDSIVPGTTSGAPASAFKRWATPVASTVGIVGGGGMLAQDISRRRQEGVKRSNYDLKDVLTRSIIKEIVDKRASVAGKLLTGAGMLGGGAMAASGLGRYARSKFDTKYKPTLDKGEKTLNFAEKATKALPYVAAIGGTALGIGGGYALGKRAGGKQIDEAANLVARNRNAYNYGRALQQGRRKTHDWNRNMLENISTTRRRYERLN